MKNAIYVLIVFMLYNCSSTTVLEPILGIQQVQYEKVFSGGDYLSMSGEGYSISVYQISEKSTKDFLNIVNRKKFFNKKEGYETIFWSKTPIEKKLLEIKNLSVSYYSNNNEITKYQKELDHILSQQNFYYTVNYKMEENTIIEIDMYVFHIASKRLYHICNAI